MFSGVQYNQIVWNSLDPDQAEHYVRPNLGLVTSRQHKQANSQRFTHLYYEKYLGQQIATESDPSLLIRAGYG